MAVTHIVQVFVASKERSAAMLNQTPVRLIVEEPSGRLGGRISDTSSTLNDVFWRADYGLCNDAAWTLNLKPFNGANARVDVLLLL
jgi:hypothetical protein